MRRLNLIIATLSLFVSQALFAEAEKTQKEQGPVQAIQSTIVKFNQLTSTATYSPQVMNLLVEKEVEPLFDFDHIASEVLLVADGKLSEDEVAFFTQKLKKNIMSTLLIRLSQARSTSFQFISARPVMGGSVAVQLRVNGYSSYPLYLDLLFHQSKDKKWQIFDIVLNSDSLINYYQKMVMIKARRYGVYGMLGRI